MNAFFCPECNHSFLSQYKNAICPLCKNTADPEELEKEAPLTKEDIEAEKGDAKRDQEID